MKKIAFKLFLLLFISGCSIGNKLSQSDPLNVVPPGTISIDDNLYIDYTEIGNIDWREYLFWISRVYGANSAEFLNAFPDTSVWSKTDLCLNSFSESYFRKPAKNFHPVVGINQEQVRKYSKWRSDRVFEQFLITRKMISEDRSPTRESHFTIERYYNGTLKTYLSKEFSPYYPSYRLPTIKEAKTAILYADSISKFELSKCRTSACKEREEWYSSIVCEIKPCKDSETPMNSGSTDKYDERRLIHLRGNLREWTAKDGITFGGGWDDSLNEIMTGKTFKNKEVNAWTGFRNVCEWKKWE